jgi:CRISPR-associated endonuclease/helicase Cas3
MFTLVENQPLSGLLTMPTVELAFLVKGRQLPADHGYGLYSSIVKLVPAIREQRWFHLQTIPGIANENGKIQLTKNAKLRIRLPWEKVPLLYGLAGQNLTIGQHQIRLEIPQIFTLRPSPLLRARIVTIKGYEDPESFLDAVKRQLEALEISCQVCISTDRKGNLARRTIKVQRYRVIGFGIIVSDLSEQDSIKLQELGLGGKHSMGCGVMFISERERRLVNE